MNNLDPNVPPVFGQFTDDRGLVKCDEWPTGGGDIIVIGDGPTKFDELDKALNLSPTALLCSVNRGANDFPYPVQMLCTIHCDSGTLGMRHAIPLLPIHSDAVVYGWQCHGDEHERVDYKMDGDPLGGTSSLIAVLCCLWAGFDNIYVIGCPMTRASGYGCDSKYGAWLKWKQRFDNRVHILGGELKEVLGGT